jgi:excisionase family DNA binding protein
MSVIKSLTTGQAARYCHVSQTTIINWIKKGELKTYTTPGGHHRILLPDFISFLEQYQIPVDPALRTPSQPRVLIVSDSPHAAILTQALKGNGYFDIALTGNDYEASAQVARLAPDAVVLDMASTTVDCLALCRWLHTSSGEKPIPVLAVGSLEDEEAVRDAGANAYVPNEAVADRLATELGALLASERNRRGSMR